MACQKHILCPWYFRKLTPEDGKGWPSIFVTLKTWQGRDPGLPHTGGKHGIKGSLRYSEKLEGFRSCTEDGFTKKQGLPKERRKAGSLWGPAAVGPTLAFHPGPGTLHSSRHHHTKGLSNVVASEYWSNQQHWDTLRLVPARLLVATDSPKCLRLGSGSTVWWLL